MKIIFVLTLLFTSHFLYGQEQSLIETHKISNWHWGLSIKASDYFRIKNFDNAYLAAADSVDIKRFNLSGGIFFNKNISSKFKFETGLFFCNKGYQTKEFTLSEYFISPHYSHMNYFKAQHIYDFYYFDIPLKFYYQLKQSKLTFYAGASVIANYCISSNDNGKFEQVSGATSYLTRTSFTDNTERSLSGISGGGEVALDFAFTNSVVSISTFYEHSFTAMIVRNYFFNGYLFSYGIEFKYAHRL
jgi:hypothetical protein